jgi:hypothetical protein
MLRQSGFNRKDLKRAKEKHALHLAVLKPRPVDLRGIPHSQALNNQLDCGRTPSRSSLREV